ncbi:MAG: NUDIX domain-containing protein [Bdellovibrionaceae bacterium]|nr:NUDIX domain-containing protein [Pseudobdellovibrionaceae bacterium]
MKSRVRASTVLIHNGRILSFFAVDPSSQKEFYFLPGGAIEAEETAPEAAERETWEETGFRVRVDAESAIDREYFFYWDGEDYDCLTIFYWGRLLSPLQDSVEDRDYNKGVAWVPLNEIKEKFGYTHEILSAIEELIEKHHRAE